MSLKGLTLVPVFGSRSVEHEISIITACQAMAVLQELGAELVPVYITKQGSWLSHPSFSELSTFRKQLPTEGDPVLLDLEAGQLRLGRGSVFGRGRGLSGAILFPLLHGTFGEDGNLAGLAAMGRLRQVGSGTLAAALAMDKLRSKAVLAAAGLPVVPFRAARGGEAARLALGELGLPLVVKPNRGGSSVGISLVQDPSDFERAVELALSYDQELVLERALSGAEDLNCAVRLRSPRCSAVERPIKEADLLSYRDKYVGPSKGRPPGGAAKGGAKDSRRELPARIPEAEAKEVQRLARIAFDALGCAGTARVDCLRSDEGELYVNEVNTLPGSLAAHLWAASGVSFPALLEELVREAADAAEERALSLPQNLLARDQLLGKA